MKSSQNFLRLVFIGFIVYTLIALFIGIPDIKKSLFLISYKWWLVSLLFPLIVHSLLSIRWFYFLRYLGCSIKLIDSIKVYFAGLTLIAAPARTGEAIRGIWLFNKYNIPVNNGVGITIVERFGELISALTLLSYSLFIYKPIFLIILITSFSIFLLILYNNQLMLNFIKGLRKFVFFRKIYDKKNFLKQVSLTYQKVRTLLLPKPLSLSIFIGMVAWILESLLLYFVFRELGVSFSLRQAIVIRTAMGIGGVLSLLPAGLLVAESTSIALSISYGSGRAEAFAATMFLRIYTLYLPFVLGILFYSFQEGLNKKAFEITS